MSSRKKKALDAEAGHDLLGRSALGPRESVEAPKDVADTLLLAAIQSLTAEVRALREELRRSRERKVQTRRVRAVRRAAEVADVPVSDVAAAAARRALARLYNK